MIISVRPTPAGTIIQLKGKLDATSSPEAQVTLERHLVTLPGPITLDCEELIYLSSAGLRTLLLLSKHNREPLTLSGLKENIREIIEISGFVCIFRIV